MPEILTLAGHAVSMDVRETSGGVFVSLQTTAPHGFRATLLAGAKHWCSHLLGVRGNSAHAYLEADTIYISAIGNRESILKALPTLRSEFKSEIHKATSDSESDLLYAS